MIATVKIAISRFKKDKIPCQITSQLLQHAKLHFLIHHQTTHFHEEYSLLQSQKELPKTSKLLNLCPLFDTETNTIRVGGRLSQGNFLEEKKFPFLVKANSNFASLILQHFHEATLHGGGQLTLNTSREEYWIPKGKNLVTKIIKNCVKCSRFSNEIPAQVMADLPAERIIESRPFTNTGIDLAGPLTTKPDNKTYIAVFVCFTTKATHLEIVQDLTKESCISALKQFIGRRGKPEKIFSDNGTNFIGVRNDLLKMQSLFSKENTKDSISNFISQKGIEWVTIPPRAPHFGGLWEAVVKSMKRHLRRTVGLQKLSYEELNTFIIQIEASLNSRPITAMSNDPNDLRPLTPAHFLIGTHMEQIPQGCKGKDISMNQRFNLLEKLKSSFWSSWHRDYLVTLQIRKKWLTAGPKFAVGDLVLLAEDNIPALKWKMARIQKLFSGNDDVNRVAELKTANGNLIRPIIKLRRLPITYGEPQSNRG